MSFLLTTYVPQKQYVPFSNNGTLTDVHVPMPWAPHLHTITDVGFQTHHSSQSEMAPFSVSVQRGQQCFWMLLIHAFILHGRVCLLTLFFQNISTANSDIAFAQPSQGLKAFDVFSVCPSCKEILTDFQNLLRKMLIVNGGFPTFLASVH